MQYVVIGHDGTDAEAMTRRLAARAAHIELGSKLRAEGKHLFGAALLDTSEKMVGSILIVDFPDRVELDEWLKSEPYVIGKVWERIEVTPCRVGPSFTSLLEKKLVDKS